MGSVAYGPAAFFGDSMSMSGSDIMSNTSVRRVGSVAGGDGSRRGSTTSNGSSSLRNKLSSGMKDRIRRLTTKRMNATIMETEEGKEEASDGGLEVLEEDFDDDENPSEMLNTKYDVIGIAQSDNTFHEAIKVVIERYNQRPNAIGAPIDPEKAASSKQMLGVEIEIYQNDRRSRGVMCIT